MKLTDQEVKILWPLIVMKIGVWAITVPGAIYCASRGWTWLAIVVLIGGVIMTEASVDLKGDDDEDPE
jgi:hypothetical protein